MGRQISVWMLALTGVLLPTAALAQTYSPEGKVVESKGFKSDKKEVVESGKDPNKYALKNAKDLSGIACLPPEEDSERACLVINDEDVFAQRATWDGRALKGKKLVRLIAEGSMDEPRGMRPKNFSCSAGKREFKDLDGEGVAFAEPYFYVAGSHGCSRHSNKAVVSSFILARVHVDNEGKPVGDASAAVTTTYRLNDILGNNPDVKSSYGKDLDGDPHGLNVEGIAAIGNELYVGLRAASDGEEAFIIRTEIDDLFASGHNRSEAAGTTLRLKLGKNVGIRDLAPLDGRRLLVLAGPTLEQEDVRFSLQVFDLETRETRKLVDLKDVSAEDGRAKAEAVWPLGGLGEPILVLFDGLENGGARLYEVEKTGE